MTEMMQTNKQDIMNKIKSGSWTFIKVSSWAVWLLVKILFWYIFAWLFLIHIFQGVNIYADFSNQMTDIKTAFWMQVILMLCFYISLSVGKKIFIYIFAWLLLILFWFFPEVQIFDFLDVLPD